MVEQFFFMPGSKVPDIAQLPKTTKPPKNKKNSRCIAGREVPIIRSPFPIRFWWVEPVSGQSSCLAMDLCPNLPAPKAEPNWRHSANPLVASPGPGAWLWADPHITRHTTHGAFWGEGRSQLGIIDHHSDLEIWMEIVQYSSLYSSLYSSFIHTYSYIFIRSLYRSKSPRSTRSDLRTSSATHQEQRLFGLVQLMVHLGRNFNDFQSATRRRDGLRRRIWKKKIGIWLKIELWWNIWYDGIDMMELLWWNWYDGIYDMMELYRIYSSIYRSNNKMDMTNQSNRVMMDIWYMIYDMMDISW